MKIEVWKNIEGWDNKYQASSFGRIKSFKYKEPRILKQRKNSQGRFYINLCINGKYQSITVHRLIATSFLGKSELTVNQKDGDKLNNKIENLEWITELDNRRHAKENNLLASADRNGRHKLEWEDVYEIREKHKNGLGYRHLGKQYCVSPNCIREVVLKISWK